MAVFPDRITLKNSTDDEATILTAIETGGANAITQGEVVLGLAEGAATLYTKDSVGSIVTISGSGGGGGASGATLVNASDSEVGFFDDPTLTVSFGANVAAGDLAVISVSARGGGDPNAIKDLVVPTGWTRPSTQDYISSGATNTDIQQSVIYKYLDSADVTAGSVDLEMATTDAGDDWYYSRAVFRNAVFSASNIVDTTLSGSLSSAGFDYTGIAAPVGGFSFVTATNVFAFNTTSGVGVTPDTDIDLAWLNGSVSGDGYEVGVVRRVSSLLGTGSLRFNIKVLNTTGDASSVTDGFHIMAVTIAPATVGGSGGGDPLFSKVTALATFDDETDGASTWTTYGSTSPTWTTNGATISSAQTRWGGTTSLSVGAGAPSIPMQLGTDDWTIEAWVMLDQGTWNNFGSIFKNGLLADTHDVIYVGPNGSNTSARFRLSNSNSTLLTITGNCRWHDDEWNHVAICRAGDTYSAYVNGEKVGSGVQSGRTFSSGDLEIGGSGSTTAYAQDFRVTSGVARYSTEYYPVPAGPLPTD